MERWSGKIALVTGASAGIGADIAKRLVQHGMIVYGCARAVDRVEQLSMSVADLPGKLIAVNCDVTKEDEVLKMFERISSEQHTLHVCINNAGMAKPASVLNGDCAEWRQVFDVNVLGARQCTKEAVRLMQEGNIPFGQILNLNSMSGHRATANSEQAAYQMAKHAVTLMTELTRREVRAMGGMIRVAQISPGVVRTEFVGRCSGDSAAAAQMYDSLDTVLEASDVADAVEYVLAAPAHVQVHDVLLRPTTQSF